MPDYTIKFPLEFNGLSVGFTPINRENIKELAFFNLKNILLTIPGERIMEPAFGVGLGAYLFEQDGMLDVEKLDGEIRFQVNAFASFIEILNIDIIFENENLNVKIKFSVPSAGLIEELDLNVQI